MLGNLVAETADSRYPELDVVHPVSAGLLRFIYVLMCRMFAWSSWCSAVTWERMQSLLVLRHENAVLRRHAGRVRYEPADRAWRAALARFVPRKRWGEVFRVTPTTLLAWHRRLAAGKYDTSKRRKPGRPSASPDIGPYLIAGWVETCDGGAVADGRGDPGDSGGPVVYAGRDAMVAGRDLKVNYLLEAPPPPARSAYLRQVERIAPPDPPGLIERDAEVADLARFCLCSDGDSYAWWQAGPWAGKSALLSTFVLRPPPEVASRVRLVSFFITARLAAQDTREAFIQVLLEQLAALLNEPLPPVLPEVSRDAFLLDLISRAAAVCAKEGKRLVLVVDGLDEDRSVIAGPNAHSVAGLLPARPPHGMRVILAGRPNPPVPDDVPDWHPLRDSGIVRELGTSPYASDVKRLSRHELQRLLQGPSDGLNILGILVAARGGLSAQDIAELTGMPLWVVEKTLHGTAGRTFARRANRWAPEIGPEAYLLGHEELQAAAEAYLGEGRLVTFQDRLHAWADAWRVRGWPSTTPEYLIGGYFRLLDSLEDLPRLAECALDLPRHNRMLDVTGGDAAAIAETVTALDRIAAQEVPDLSTALALACHRDQIASRNMAIPASLPTVWAAVGQLSRAKTLAASITTFDARAQALAGVAQALTAAGQHEQATVAAMQAQAAARSIAKNDARAQALAKVTGTLAAAGLYEQAAATAMEAQAVARSAANHDTLGQALAEAAGALAAAGLHEQAMTFARSITNPSIRKRALARALAEVAKTLAEAHLHERAVAAAGEAQAAATSLSTPRGQAQTLAEIAAILAAAAGLEEQVTACAAEAEAIAQSISRPAARAQALAVVGEALAAAGMNEQAQALAGSITNSSAQARILVRVVQNLAASGLGYQAQALANSISNHGTHGQAMVDVAGTLAGAGMYEQAYATAQAILSPDWQAQALAGIARALAAAGLHEQATATATQAEEAARSTTSPFEQGGAMVDVAGTLAGAGMYEQAYATAQAILSPDWQAQALAGIARALAAAGLHEQATATATQAGMTARSITSDGSREWALAQVAGTLAAAGLYEQADIAAKSITRGGARAQALAKVAIALTEIGLHKRARETVAQAEATMRPVTDSYYRAKALADITRALATVGLRERAVITAVQAGKAARTITNSSRRAQMMAEVAETLAAAGLYEQAQVLTRTITRPDWRAHARAGIVGALATAGQHEEAQKLARSLTHPGARAQGLAHIAGALAAAGQTEQASAAGMQAEVAARSITEPSERGRVLADVTEALVKAGYVDSARRLAAVTCTNGTWTTAIKPVLLLAPSAWMPALAILQAR